MKAVVVTEFGSAEHMKYVDLEIPKVQPHQVLIRVHATSVNFADIKSRYGKKGQALPFIPGLEAAGIIEQVGSDVTHFHVGQRVLAFPHNGSYAEYVVADEALTFALPDFIDFETAGASGIVTFLTYNLLAEVAKLQRREAVLIHSAAGGVGTTAIQIAKALGAGMVIGTVGSEQKVEIAKAAGADYVFTYDTEDYIEQIQSATQGKGVDLILDSVGGKITEQSMACLANFGRCVIFGNSSGSYAQLSTSLLHSSCRSLLGYSFGTTRKERPETLKKTAQEVFRLFEAGKIHIHIGRRFTLQEARLAHEWVESRQSTGKALILC